MVKGLDTFQKYFADYEEQYVLIGGAACDILFESNEVNFRATRDLDMVLIVEALTPEFGEKFWEFIVDGKYRNKATNGSNPQFYRFDKAEDDEFPKMIELFCRSDFKLKMQKELLQFILTMKSPVCLQCKYYLVETKTIDGFVLDDTPIEADLSYIDQNTKVVFAGMDVTNERQKVQITVTKTDSETKEALEGAVFGLFAKDDIVNKDSKVIVKADTQIERTVTGKDGKAAFTSDLPLGQYYVKEIEAPKGYVKSDKIFDVDASYQGDGVLRTLR